MKVRKVIVFVVAMLFIATVYLVSYTAYEYGVSYGESHAEEIRAVSIKNVESTDSKKYDSVFFSKNEIIPIKVNGSGRVKPGTIINISS